MNDYANCGAAERIEPRVWPGRQKHAMRATNESALPAAGSVGRDASGDYWPST